MKDETKMDLDSAAKPEGSLVELTRQVDVGPVAKRLAHHGRPNPKKTRFRFTPLWVLAVGVVCACLAVAAFQQAESHRILQLSQISTEAESVESKPRMPRAKTVGTPVGSVLQLVDAFESLDESPAEPAGPLSPIVEDPTAPVAFYVSEQENKEDTDLFLQQLDAATDDGESETIADSEPDSEQTEVSTEVALLETDEPVDAASVDAPIVDAAIVEIEQTELARLLEITIENAPETPTANDLMANRDVAAEMEAENALEPAADLTLARAAHDQIVEIVADQIVAAEIVVDETEEVETEEVETEEVETEEVETEDKESSNSITLGAIEDFRVATKAFRKSLDDRAAAQQYYLSCAKLCWLANEYGDDDAIADELRVIYEDQNLFQLVSAAATSWVHWSDRPTNGVLVAGQVESTAIGGDKVVLQVRTRDKYKSLLSIELESATSSELRAGETVLVIGITGDAVLPNDSPPKIIGRCLPRKSQKTDSPNAQF